jgi:hypothetical protein
MWHPAQQYLIRFGHVVLLVRPGAEQPKFPPEEPMQVDGSGDGSTATFSAPRWVLPDW